MKVLYGGSVTMLAVNLARYGIDTTFVDASSPDAFAAAMRPNTRAVFAESLGNPSMLLLDLAAVADVAHAHGLPLVILRTARFFPEADDMAHAIPQTDANTKANELLFRRLTVEDAAEARRPLEGVFSASL